MYQQGNIESKGQLYRDYSERLASCINDNDTVKLNLIAEQSYEEIRKINLKQTHLGLIVIGVKGMHKKGSGTKVLITLYDGCFTDPEHAILGVYEIDM